MLVGTYLFQAILSLIYLYFNGCMKIKPVITHLEAHLANLGGFLAFWRPMRGAWVPQTNIFYFVCLILVVIYLYHASWGLNHLDINSYKNLYPDVAHFAAHVEYLGPFQGS